MFSAKVLSQSGMDQNSKYIKLPNTAQFDISSSVKLVQLPCGRESMTFFHFRYHNDTKIDTKVNRDIKRIWFEFQEAQMISCGIVKIKKTSL